MSHRPRWYVPDTVYEVTNRTIQERYLLKPSEESRALLVGVIAMALQYFTSVRVHAFVFLSNHCHLLISAAHSEQIAPFLRYVFGNTSREMGRSHDWNGPLWHRPCAVIPILDEDAQISRLRYLLSNAVKEGLVSSPRLWPGATSVHGLLGDMRVTGNWIDRDGLRRAKRNWKRKCALVEHFTKAMTVELSPLPVWANLSASALRARHETLVASIEHQGRFRRALYLGIKKVLEVEPHDRPTSSSRSPAPCCHASHPGTVRLFRELYRNFVAAFRGATKSLLERPPTTVPRGSFPRPNWFHRSTPDDSLDRVAVVTPSVNAWG
jgi:REP element-mobilizing transposase RayT